MIGRDGNPNTSLDDDPESLSENMDSIEKEKLEKDNFLDKNYEMDRVRDKYANTSPLGIIGFGMATVMLNLANAGLYEINGMVLGLGFFHGGFAQLIAGYFEIKKGHTFSATTFLSSTAFWFSFVTMTLCPNFLGCKETDNIALGTFNLFWGIFTALMLVAVMKNGHISNILLLTALVVNFFMISIGLYSNFAIFVKVGGAFGVISGMIGIYNGCADIINGEYGKYVLPL